MFVPLVPRPYVRQVSSLRAKMVFGFGRRPPAKAEAAAASSYEYGIPDNVYAQQASCESVSPGCCGAHRAAAPGALS